MMNKSALQVQSRDFPHGYLVVVVATESDEFCGIKKEENQCGRRINHNLKKVLKITEKPNTQSSTTIRAISLVTGIYLGIILVSLVLTKLLFRFDIRLLDGNKRPEIRNQKNFDGKAVLSVIGKPLENPNEKKPDVVKQESLIVDAPDLPDAKEVICSRLKKTIYVSDLCQKLELLVSYC